LISRWKAPKPPKSRDKLSMYACGERLPFQRLRITVTLYKYLIYFVIVDSSVLLMAFASLAVGTMSPYPLLMYLLTVLTALLLLLGGD